MKSVAVDTLSTRITALELVSGGGQSLDASGVGGSVNFASGERFVT